jgi:hypothetical protein
MASRIYYIHGPHALGGKVGAQFRRHLFLVDQRAIWIHEQFQPIGVEGATIRGGLPCRKVLKPIGCTSGERLCQHEGIGDGEAANKSGRKDKAVELSPCFKVREASWLL